MNETIQKKVEEVFESLPHVDKVYVAQNGDVFTSAFDYTPDKKTAPVKYAYINMINVGPGKSIPDPALKIVGVAVRPDKAETKVVETGNEPAKEPATETALKAEPGAQPEPK